MDANILAKGEIFYKIPPKASLKTAVTAVFNPMPFYKINQKLYPDIFSSSLLWFSAYVIHCPEYMKRVLQENHKNYNKGGKYGFIRLLLGNGLLTSDDDHWLKHRRVIQPSFHQKSLDYSRQVMIQETSQLIATWGKSGIHNANALMATLTINIVGKSMFGLNSGEKIKELRHQLELCQKYGHNLLRMPIDYPSWILDIPLFSRLDAAIKNVHGIINHFITGRLNTSSDRQDLLDLMMALRYEDTGEAMPVRQIQDELLTLIVAGHETTTLALSWTLYELARNTLIQECIREELFSVIQHQEDFTFDKLGQLPHLTNAINESMRLYPPAYLFARTAKEDDYLGPYHVPAGKNIVVNLYGLHRHPRFWEDAEKYNPDRLANFDMSGMNRFVFMPFGAGPRGCIGVHFAMAEMKIIIGSILMQYRLRVDNTELVVPKPLFTLNPSEPIRLRIDRL